MVTVGNAEKRMEELQHLEIAGVSKPDPDLGPAVILWIKLGDGDETWEVLPEWVAELVVSDLHNDATVERAAIYWRIPKNAPMDVARKWLQARMTRSHQDQGIF